MTTLLKKAASPAVILALSAAPQLAQAAGDYGLNAAAKKAGLNTSGTNLETRAGELVSSVIGFVGIIYMILIIVAGIMWMTAAGNEERVGKARKIIIGATIGVIIVFSAWSITNLVLQQL